jgi:hypothetical protein
MRRAIGIVAMALVTSAHVGSPDAWFEGFAGPYTITVHIEAPPVVPGIAVVNVKAADSSVNRITAFVNTYDAEGGTPPPDELVPIADRPGWRSARLWVMYAGSNSVTVDAYGASGKGSVVIPLAAIAQRRLAVGRTFSIMILIGAGVLVWGMLSIVGSAVREGVLEPGMVPDESRRRRARFAMARGAVVIALALTGTLLWWRAEDRAFRARMFRPLSIDTRVDTSSGAARLILSITDSAWLARDEVDVLRARGELPPTGLVDDHGKLMHLFLVADGGKAAMAHLHPETRDSVTFTSVLPGLPSGTYRVFADIVHRSGFTQTLTSNLAVPSIATVTSLTDTDDSWTAADAADSTQSKLDDGTLLTWRRDGPIVAKEEAGLRFELKRAPGDTASLQTYLGMPGHAVVVRDDGRVFIHLHPMGTISPAAQARLSPSSGMHFAAHSSQPLTDSLYFPYAFPEPGRYTVWVQLKRNGRILTGAFSADAR